MRKQYTVHYNESGEIACEGTFYSKSEEFDDYFFHERMNTEYSKLTPLRLSLSYEQVCEEYRLRLCNQFGIDWNDTYWIVGRVGGVLDIQSYYAIDMDELRYIVDNSMTFEDFEEWYNQWIYTDNKNRINLRSWLMGARPELFKDK